MKLLIMQFSPTSRHFISLRSKYFPQHPVQSEQLYVRKITVPSKNHQYGEFYSHRTLETESSC
jgi:hypothetical protein